MSTNYCPGPGATTDLKRLAELVAARNRLDRQIAELVGRPALIGHVGEFIASRVFGIDLESSAVTPAIDGRFRTGALAGSSVNIKWYAKREGVLDITAKSLPDYYLVLAGPKVLAESSCGQTRPWTIASAHLFDSGALLTALAARRVKVGVATSVYEGLWSAAEIFPGANPALPLSPEQRRLLALFGDQV